MRIGAKNMSRFHNKKALFLNHTTSPPVRPQSHIQRALKPINCANLNDILLIRQKTPYCLISCFLVASRQNAKLYFKGCAGASVQASCSISFNQTQGKKTKKTTRHIKTNNSQFAASIMWRPHTNMYTWRRSLLTFSQSIFGDSLTE